MQAKVALAGYRHAERSVCEHLDLDFPTRRSAYIVPVYDGLYLLYLSQIELPREDDNISELRIETQGFCI